MELFHIFENFIQLKSFYTTYQISNIIVLQTNNISSGNLSLQLKQANQGHFCIFLMFSN